MFVELLWTCMNLSGPQEIFQEDLQPPANSVSGLRVGLIWTNLDSRLWRVWWIWWVWGVWVVHSSCTRGCHMLPLLRLQGRTARRHEHLSTHHIIELDQLGWSMKNHEWRTSKSHLFLKEPCFRSIRCDWEATVLFVFFSCLYCIYFSRHNM